MEANAGMVPGSGNESMLIRQDPQDKESGMGVPASGSGTPENVLIRDDTTSSLPGVSTKSSAKRKRSIVWDHFTRMDDGSDDKHRASCNYCKQEYACHPKNNGTTSMLTHLESQCKKYPFRKHDKSQTTLGFKPKKDTGEVELVALSFSAEACRKALAEMIIMDELSFKFIEGEGFRRFIHIAQPKWLNIPSRITLARDCFKVFLTEKKTLKKALRGQRICLTTDTWTSLQNLNYMCLTAHYIDNDWKLQKKILNFCLVSNHKGETLGKTIETCLLDWGIDKFLTITVDNASSNNGAIQFLKRKTKNRKSIILEHDFLHMRCCAHILNLIVCEGLKEIDESILKVRNAVRYVRSSPSRMAKFKICAEKEGIVCKGQVCLDVATRWNSTYLMLERALQFQKAFERLEEDDTNFQIVFRDEQNDDRDGDDDGIFGIDGSGLRGSGKGKSGRKTLGPPDELDWNKARMFVKFLKLFYNATLRFSGSLCVTSNAFFMEIMVIQNAINKLTKNSDLCLSLMAEGMKEKFDKYWGKFEKINLLLFVAVVLDPRYKLKYVKWCFEKCYHSFMVEDLVKKVRDGLTRLYEWYVMHDQTNVVQDQNVSGPSGGNDDEDNEEDARAFFVSQFKRHLEEEDNLTSKSELERFLAEVCEEDSPNFDILIWWKTNSIKYRILSQVARDILAIPVSTVASESTFSTGGRILDPFRSSLSPSTVEALICTQNWLRSSSSINLKDEMDEVEQYDNLDSVFAEYSSASSNTTNA